MLKGAVINHVQHVPYKYKAGHKEKQQILTGWAAMLPFSVF